MASNRTDVGVNAIVQAILTRLAKQEVPAQEWASLVAQEGLLYQRLKELWESYQRRDRRVFCSMQDDIDDALAHLYQAIHRGSYRVQPDTPFIWWAIKVASNYFRDVVRRERRWALRHVPLHDSHRYPAGEGGESPLKRYRRIRHAYNAFRQTPAAGHRQERSKLAAYIMKWMQLGLRQPQGRPPRLWGAFWTYLQDYRQE